MPACLPHLRKEPGSSYEECNNDTDLYSIFHFLKREERHQWESVELVVLDMGTIGRMGGFCCCREAFSPILQMVKPDTERELHTVPKLCQS